jgi:uncharacterized membrane-anchored protein YhcB (DUF1043 family)
MLVLEVVMNVWLWVVVAFLAGGLVGAGIIALLRRGADVEQRMRRLRREYEQYQAEVARHFAQTGEMLSRLRTTFDQLYDEVEERATALVAEEALQRRLGYLDSEPRAPAPPAVEGGPRPEPPIGDERPSAPGFGNTDAGRPAASRADERAGSTDEDAVHESETDQDGPRT